VGDLTIRRCGLDVTFWESSQDDENTSTRCLWRTDYLVPKREPDRIEPECTSHIKACGCGHYLIADLAAAYTLVGGSAE
jgi:hypothetical protein